MNLRQQGLDFSWITGRDDGHLRKRPHDCEILGCEMRRAKSSIRQSAADGDHAYSRPVIADVVSDLLQTTKRGEVSDAVRVDDKSAHRESGCDAGKVLFSDTDVGKLCRVSLAIIVEHAESEIAGEQQQARIARRQLVETTGERVPHSSPTSERAFASSS